MLGLGIDAQVDKWEFNAGDCWTEKIYSMIGQADAVVVVLSKNSINAEWVREEINAALVQRVKRGMGLLPVILDGLKSDDIPQALHHIQWVRVNAGDSAGAADQINRAMRGLRNPRKPTLGFASKQEFAMPESPPPALSLAALRQMAAGDAMAQFHLGVMYHMGEGVPQDDAEAAKWTRRAAEQGHPQAQHNLGVAYHKGDGVPQDFAEAAKWTRRAAEQGHPQAQNNLGVAYADGIGVAEDCAEAAKWFRRAAERGIAQSQFNLGLLYRNGYGMSPDDKEAAKWFRRAAEQGHAGAQLFLAEELSKKDDAASNRESFVWYSLAALGGIPIGLDGRDNIAERMSGDELESARNEVRRRREEIRRKRAEGGE